MNTAISIVIALVCVGTAIIAFLDLIEEFMVTYKRNFA